MNNSRYLLRAERVSKTYPNGAVKALVEVTLGVQAGEFVCIMGPSGSGKSTLLNILGSLDRPDQGEVFFEGRSLGRRNLDRLRSQKLGFVFQSFLLLPTLTALENVQVPMFEGPLGATARAGKACNLLAEVGLSQRRANHRPFQLSIGERQRVAIARALANDPVIILADEPIGNLDTHTGKEILDLFDRLRRNLGLTLVVVTHSEAQASRADRIIFLQDGQTVEHLG